MLGSTGDAIASYSPIGDAVSSYRLNYARRAFLAAVMIVPLLGVPYATADEPAPPQGELISSIGSERATSGAGAKIVTFHGGTHVVWQDATDEGYFNRVRTLDHATGKWSEPFTLNRGRDNHARPIITVDENGTLHAILSGHNSPVTYRRSLRPGDSSAWTKEESAGSGTYPVLVCAPGGTLYLTLRNSQRWNGVDLYVKPPDGPWRMTAKLVKRDPKLPGYAGFQNCLAWSPDYKTLHFLVDFYESKQTYKDRGVHQAVCTMRSHDGGVSWERADGTLVPLPARPEQMDILARSIGKRHEQISPPVILAQGCLVVDPEGTPHVLYISHLDKPGQIIHATSDAQGAWQQTPVDAIEQAFPQMRPIGCRGALTIDQQGTMYALLELVPLGPGWIDGKPTRAMRFKADQKRLAWLVSRDRGKTFTVADALKPGTDFNQANVERPTGFNAIAPGDYPAFLYFDGTSRYREKGEVLQNKVYFVRPGL